MQPGSRIRTHPPVRHVTVPSPDTTKSLMDCTLNTALYYFQAQRRNFLRNKTNDCKAYIGET